MILWILFLFLLSFLVMERNTRHDKLNRKVLKITVLFVTCWSSWTWNFFSKWQHYLLLEWEEEKNGCGSFLAKKQNFLLSGYGSLLQIVASRNLSCFCVVFMRVNNVTSVYSWSWRADSLFSHALVSYNLNILVVNYVNYNYFDSEINWWVFAVSPNEIVVMLISVFLLLKYQIYSVYLQLALCNCYCGHPSFDIPCGTWHR